jgi:hypothetical protein
MISGPRERLMVILFACLLLAAYVALAFGAGWLFGSEML